MGKRLVPAIFIFLLLFAVTTMFFSFPSLFRPSPDPDTVRGNIQELQTLATTRYEYREVVYFDQQTRLLGIPAGTKEMLFSVRIDVIAGLDLDESVTVEPGNRRKREVFVTLPAPRILRVTAQEDTIDQYFVHSGLGTIDWLYVTDLLEAAKEKNRDDAVSRGILDRARSHGEVVLRGLLTAAGYETIHIRFRSAGRDELRG